MKAKYNGLIVREASADEAKAAVRFWADSFSGLMVERLNVGTFFVLKDSLDWTPHMCYRINAEQTELIHANYSSYDLIHLENGIAVAEAHDVEDRF